MGEPKDCCKDYISRADIQIPDKVMAFTRISRTDWIIVDYIGRDIVSIDKIYSCNVKALIGKDPKELDHILVSIYRCDSCDDEMRRIEPFRKLAKTKKSKVTKSKKKSKRSTKRK